MAKHRGSITEPLYLMVALVAMTISLFVMNFSYAGISVGLLSMVNGTTDFANVQPQITEAVTTGQNQINAAIDWIPFFYILMLISATSYAWLIRANPIALPLTIVTLLVLVWNAGYVSNFIGTLLGTPLFSQTANNHSLVTQLNLNLPLVVIVSGMIILVVMYGKNYIFGAGDGQP